MRDLWFDETRLFQQHEFEKNEIFGWGFPAAFSELLDRHRWMFRSGKKTVMDV